LRHEQHIKWEIPVKYVRDIPKLGTGKVDHRELQKVISEDKIAK
jgi:hypothetical protein